MASNATKARPYRKASEYLVQARRRPESLEPKSPLEIENEELRQKVHALTRKCEHAEVEYMQSREYMENQLDQVQDKYDILNRNYSKLKTQFEALTNAARQLSEKNTKTRAEKFEANHSNMQISRLESEKLALVKDIDDLTQRISESKNSYFKLQQENERLRKDCNLAVQLLRCNKSNYQVQKREELPVDLRKRVDETSVSMEGYNEYINPYGDCDSDEGGDEDVTSYSRDNDLDAGIGNSTSAKTGPGEVSVDVLANVLEKAENVHMNLEESDYISDHQLNSSYTARFLDRKLIKVDNSNGDLERTKLPPPPVPTAPQPQESSPWELAPTSHNRPAPKYDPDMDESAAAAYGVYSLPLKRRNRDHVMSSLQHQILPKPPPPASAVTTTQPTTSLSSPSLIAYTSSPPPPPPPHAHSDVIEERASSPEDFEFRRPLTKAAVVAVENNNMAGAANQKSPRHQARKEKASNDEKASLLLVDESDSDDPTAVVDAIKFEQKLDEKVEQQEEDEEEEVKDGVDLEWDSTLHHHPEPPPLDGYQEADNNEEPEAVKDDLLLSYHDVTVDVKRPAPPVAISLDDIFGPDDAEADRLKELLASPEHGADEQAVNGAGGSLLLESLIESPPPPPEQFAAESAADVDDDGGEDVERDGDELRSSSTRRRNTSMERAQEFGNVLD